MFRQKSVYCAIVIIISIVFAVFGDTDKAGWQREDVDWQLSPGMKIKSIRYQSKEKQAHNFGKGVKARSTKREILKGFQSDVILETQIGPLVGVVIESPPINGFVPWVSILTTNARGQELDLYAVPSSQITGTITALKPDANFGVGIFDTGASASVMGHAVATDLGLFRGNPDYMTGHTSTVFGVSGSVDVWVSEPIGIFIDGIGAIEPNGFLIHRNGMKGETNTAIAVGKGNVGLPDLPTAIGVPLSVFFTAAINNENTVTIHHKGTEYSGPDMKIYDQNDPCIPTLANTIPLELRPLGGEVVGYITPLDIFDPDPYSPATPSIVMGMNPTQSVFFVSSVDLYKGTKSAIDKNRFMLDTGAQVSVIGTRIAARLAVDIVHPSFEVDIQGVTGNIITVPGFYIDRIDIPALGEWFSANNVPVILLDIPSPEGGTADGIMGMNLFTNFNMVFRGGGLFLQNDPALEFEQIPCNLIGDIAPPGGDCAVDEKDLAEFAKSWLTTPVDAGWNPLCDFDKDNKIDFPDYAILAGNWYIGK